MKIVHINWTLDYGGIETMLVNIVNEQCQKEKIYLIIINDEVQKELIKKINSKVKIIRLNRKVGSKWIGFYIILKKTLNKINPDIIHTHQSALINFIPKKWYDKVCNTVHDLPSGIIGPQNRLFSILKWLKGKNENVLCLDRIKRVFAISLAVHDQLESKYNIKSLVVHNGIQSDRFVIKHHIPSKGSFKIIQVSRLEHVKKGQDLLIEAVHQLISKGYRIDLTFIGDGVSKAFLHQQATELNIDNHIVFLGTKAQSYIREHLCDYDIFVQPSRYEGFGLTVAEAMAAKVPVLVSSGQGPEEVTEGEIYGWTFENGNTEDLAKKLSYIIDQYNESLKKAEEAYLHVKENYDVSVTAKKYIEAYKTMTNNEEG